MGARFGDQDRCKDASTRHGYCRGIAHALDRGRTSLTAFATVARVTAARSRSVWYAPPTGWVTVLAGLLARGSAPEVQPSQFPSGSDGRQTRRLQLRGQPRWRLLKTAPCSLLPPRLAPRNQHTISILL